MEWSYKESVPFFGSKYVPNDNYLVLVFESGPLAVLSFVGGGGLAGDIHSCGLTPDSLIRVYLTWHQVHSVTGRAPSLDSLDFKECHFRSFGCATKYQGRWEHAVSCFVVLKHHISHQSWTFSEVNANHKTFDGWDWTTGPLICWGYSEDYMENNAFSVVRGVWSVSKIMGTRKFMFLVCLRGISEKVIRLSSLAMYIGTQWHVISDVL